MKQMKLKVHPNNMRERIRQAVAEANDLEGVKRQLMDVLSTVRLEERLKQTEGCARIGYVAGIVTSDGPERIWENVAKLIERTEAISQEVDFPVFSSAWVFTSDVFERINAESYPQEAWLEFWREVLGSSLITDVFMTQRWRESRGASDEEETARNLGLRIHYEEEG
jgi:hypothetical protein